MLMLMPILSNIILGEWAFFKKIATFATRKLGYFSLWIPERDVAQLGTPSPVAYLDGEANCDLAQYRRDVAQLGSVLAWGARGRRFKSCHPDKDYQALMTKVISVFFV